MRPKLAAGPKSNNRTEENQDGAYPDASERPIDEITAVLLEGAQEHHIISGDRPGQIAAVRRVAIRPADLTDAQVVFAAIAASQFPVVAAWQKRVAHGDHHDLALYWTSNSVQSAV